MPFGGLAHGSRSDGLFGMIAASALKTILDALDLAGTNYLGDEGLLVKIDTSANYTVTICGNSERPEGQVVRAQKHDTDYWHLAVDFFGFLDAASAWNSGRPRQKKLYYGTGTIALGQMVLVNNAGTNYHWVDGANSGGVGKVIAKDDPSGYVQIFY